MLRIVGGRKYHLGYLMRAASTAYYYLPKSSYLYDMHIYRHIAGLSRYYDQMEYWFEAERFVMRFDVPHIKYAAAILRFIEENRTQIAAAFAHQEHVRHKNMHARSTADRVRQVIIDRLVEQPTDQTACEEFMIAAFRVAYADQMDGVVDVRRPALYDDAMVDAFARHVGYKPTKIDLDIAFLLNASVNHFQRWD